MLPQIMVQHYVDARRARIASRRQIRPVRNRMFRISRELLHDPFHPALEEKRGHMWQHDAVRIQLLIVPFERRRDKLADEFIEIARQNGYILAQETSGIIELHT